MSEARDKILPIRVRIQAEDFDLESEINHLKQFGDIGAIASFVGLCRDEGGKLNALELEHYPGMAEAQIMQICEHAKDRFSLIAITAIHRYGKIAPSENIVLVVAASSHRQASFDGANFVMDFLKTDAPFWKKEHLKGGSSGDWVDAKDKDDAAKDKWFR
ncbi:molybdenum cofactor biosynthesis protein MoaE [Lentilitoribacter sp. Alg239-R112]|uniref:molybdenum cofactor biosynthesis protein MoaE n=1 Tax=Lentilitoribacter sp. Alg239-R112 TaxID=2305987 RepID=UPI0013A6F034|nr:molybdenum cofactor biosynthesis protein MoaE [Lentilitoribacter sp. Alg239-R112]